MIEIKWHDLPFSAQAKIDTHIGYFDDNLTEGQCVDNLNVLLDMVNATFDTDTDIITFQFDSDYTLFLLRWT